jgi:enoyl-CoA hydratase/carnithine racemase
VPDLGGTKRLVELVGYARAMDICSPAAGSARRGDRLGLATSVVPADGWTAVAALTGQILAASATP